MFLFMRLYGVVRHEPDFNRPRTRATGKRYTLGWDARFQGTAPDGFRSVAEFRVEAKSHA